LAVLAAAVVACRPLLPAGSAWLGGSPGGQGLPQQRSRRDVGAALLGGLATLALQPPTWVLAEEAPPALTPSTFSTSSSTTGLVPGPTKDFVVRTPSSWITSLDSYPGRLVFSTERPSMDGTFMFMQVSRLNLPALFRSANAVLPDANAASSKWEELTVGDTTAATLAKWMLDAQQKSIQLQVGRSFVRNIDISDAQIKSGGGASSGSELSWHGLVSIPAGGLTGGEAVQGSGGRLYSLSDQPDSASPSTPPRMVSGKALLRGGVVVFAVMDGPKARWEADIEGTPGMQFFDSIVQSLELTAPQEA